MIDETEKEITIIDGEFAEVNQLPAALEANVTAIQENAKKALDSGKIDDDFEFARTNLYVALTKGATALEELAEIARQSQHPRAYEVLAGLLKNFGDVNDKMMELHASKQDLAAQATNGVEGSSNQRPLVGNAVFVGSTSELLQLIKQQKN
jgi:hypothetical protein